MANLLASWKHKARVLTDDMYAVYLAARDPHIPWYARALALLVAGYAFSPIDLIPDFIPVLGYLDDLLLVPLGIAIVIRLIPLEVLEEKRRQARLEREERKPVSSMAAVMIILSWAALICLVVHRILK